MPAGIAAGNAAGQPPGWTGENHLGSSSTVTQRKSLQLIRLERCPICRSGGSTHYKTHLSLFNPGEEISYDLCEGCGTVYRNPRPEEGARLEAYRDRPVVSVDPEVGWDGWLPRGVSCVSWISAAAWADS
jgi:hypothetical protein